MRARSVAEQFEFESARGLSEDAARDLVMMEFREKGCDCAARVLAMRDPETNQMWVQVDHDADCTGFGMEST